MADHDYMHGGWKDKYKIFKHCKDCKGSGLHETSASIHTAGPEVDVACNSIPLVVPCEACRGRGIVACDWKAIYFVLRLDEDPHARTAALAYARSVQSVNPQFAREITQRVLAIIRGNKSKKMPRRCRVNRQKAEGLE